MSKVTLASKTVWFNVITLFLEILALPNFLNLLPQEWLPYLILIQGIGNLVLRIFFTDKPIVGFIKTKREEL